MKFSISHNEALPGSDCGLFLLATSTIPAPQNRNTLKTMLRRRNAVVP